MLLENVRWVLDWEANKVAVQLPVETWTRVVGKLERLRAIWKARPQSEWDDPECIVRRVVVPSTCVHSLFDKEGERYAVQMPAAEWDQVIEYLEDLQDTLAFEEPDEPTFTLEEVFAEGDAEGSWRTAS